MREFNVPPWRLPLSSKQAEGLKAFTRCWPRDFLAVMCPKGGKSRLALAIAHEAFRDERIDALIIGVRSYHGRITWAQECDRVGIPIVPDFRGRLTTEFKGGAVTFAGLASAAPALEKFMRSRRVMVIIDGLHHTSEWSTWGSTIERVYDPAAHRILLASYAVRRDGVALPWVRYDASQVAIANVGLTYPEARAAHVVRPIVAHPIGGSVKWRGADGNERSASIEGALSVDESAERLRGVLQDQEFIDNLIRNAHATLVALRRGDPVAGGIVFAMSANHAKFLAKRVVAVAGVEPVLVLSEDVDADLAIERFRSSRDPWVIAVKKMSEMDMPRLRVCAYLTHVRSPGSVLESLGLVMSRRGEDVRPSYVFFPADPLLSDVVAALLEQKDEDAAAGDDLTDDLLYQPIAMPVDPWAVSEIGSGGERDAEPLFEVREDLRNRHTALVRAVAARYGTKQMEVYRQLKGEFGTTVEQASIPQLRQRVRLLSKWLESGFKRRR